MFAIDCRETWLVHNHLNPNEPEFDSVDRERFIREILGVGDDFSYEVITKEDWVSRRLVADRFRKARSSAAAILPTCGCPTLATA